MEHGRSVLVEWTAETTAPLTSLYTGIWCCDSGDNIRVLEAEFERLNFIHFGALLLSIGFKSHRMCW